MEKLIDLYKKWAGEEPADVIKLAGQGSNRQYFRIIGHDGDTVIGVIGTSRDEDHAFVYLAQHFQLRQLPVPQILAVSDDELCYLQTDLGGTSLFDAIKGGRDAGGRYNQKEKELLKKTIRELPNIQIRGARGLEWQNCYPQPEFDVDSVLFDLLDRAGVKRITISVLPFRQIEINILGHLVQTIIVIHLQLQSAYLIFIPTVQAAYLLNIGCI